MSVAAYTYVDTVVKYFNPSRSPFYAIIAVGVVSLELADRSVGSSNPSRWHLVAAILLLIISVAVLVSLSSKSTMALAEYTDQLSLARSICVSAALIALYYFADEYKDDARFYLVLSMAVFQSATFILYIWAGEDQPKEISETNYVQLGLVTTTLFFGASFLLKALIYTKDLQLDAGASATSNFPATVLIILWLACMRIWWRVIAQLVVFLDRKKRPESQKSAIEQATARTQVVGGKNDDSG